MNVVDPDALLRAVDFLTSQLESGLSDSETPMAPGEIEKIARAISAQIKTLNEIDAYNIAALKRDAGEKYISYEDYPPLRPDDRSKIISELDALLARIETPAGSTEGDG